MDWEIPTERRLCLNMLACLLNSECVHSLKPRTYRVLDHRSRLWGVALGTCSETSRRESEQWTCHSYVHAVVYFPRWLLVIAVFHFPLSPGQHSLLSPCPWKRVWVFLLRIAPRPHLACPCSESQGPPTPDSELVYFQLHYPAQLLHLIRSSSFFISMWIVFWSESLNVHYICILGY